MSLWDDLKRAVMPQSDAEKEVERMMTTPATSYTPPYNDVELGAWDRFKIAIMPESYAESIANKMMHTPGAVPFELDDYDVEDFSSPNIFVKGKAMVGSAVDFASGGMWKLIIFISVAMLLAVVLNAFVRGRR